MSDILGSILIEEGVRERALQHAAGRRIIAPSSVNVAATHSAQLETSSPPTTPAQAQATLTCDGIATGPLDNPEDERRRLYVSDLRRAGLVECVQQTPPDLVRIMVGPKFKTLSAEDRDARFSRLLGTYGSWGTVWVELWTSAGKFGEYADGQYRGSTTPRLAKQ